MNRDNVLSERPIMLQGADLKSRPRSGSVRSGISLAIFLLPSLIIILGFKLVPVVVSLGISFFEQDLIRRTTFVGLTNFRMILTDRLFWKATTNVVLFASWYITLSLLLGFSIALLLNSKLVRSNLLRAVCIAPILLSPAVASWIFRLLLSPKGGVLDSLSTLFPFLSGIDVLKDPRLGVPVMLAITVWNTAGFFVIIFLSGLKTLDKELYAAATLDGASSWGQLRYLILPGLKPLFLIGALIGLVVSYQLFDPVLVLRTGGFSTDALGPGSSRALPVYLIFRSVFRSFRQGDWPLWSGPGGAMTFLFLLQFSLVAVLGAGIFRLLRRRGG